LTTLEHLVHCCHGDDRPDCPIIDTLESAVPVTALAPHGHAHHGLRPGKHAKRVATGA
jgi:hypothetical protein